MNDEATILKIGEAYDLAWNRGDTQALVSFFAPDTIVVNPRGEATYGKTKFEQTISNLFSSSFKGSTHKTKILHIHFPKENVAVVDGEATLILLKPLEGNCKLTHRYTDVMIKEGKRWLISDTRAYVYMESLAS